jgi:hypothetical protein
MPLHHRSWRDRDKRLFPSRPKPSQSNPEQLVHCQQSTAWSLDVQSQQLLSEGEVLED